ncbi:MAG: hypothetical protein ACF8R7_16580 [Phycisphaerales bacterium JB039]
MTTPRTHDQGGWGGAGAAQRPVERILGPGALWAGPYSLLGIAPGPVDDDVILGALDRRLDQVGAHPLRDAPEADETRLALHAAAAQLLDPAVRQHLEARWSGARPPASAPAPEPSPGQRVSRRTPAEVALEHDAVVTLGLYGGWNQRALRRLTMLAHARGLSSHAVAMTLQRLASPRAAPALRAAGGMGPGPVQRTMREQLNAPDADEVDPAPLILRHIGIVLGALGLSVAASALLVAAVLAALKQPQAPAPPTAAPITQAPLEPDPAERRIPVVTPAPAAADVMEADAAARALRTLAGADDVGYAESMRRFDLALRGLERSWPDLTSMQRIAATDSLVEFVYRAARWPGGAREAVARIARPSAVLAPGAVITPDAAIPAIWSAGALSRLARERDVPSGAQAEIRRALASSLGAREVTFERSFEAGAAAAIGALADRLSESPEDFWSGGDAVDAWESWMRAVTATAGDQHALRERLTLAGLESLLVRGPEPSASESVFRIVRTLTGALRWRADELARPTLLRWFDDRRMTAADLHAVTSALAGGSSAQGVDITMVLPVLASDRVRAELRARYASAWGLGAGIDREQAVSGWYEAAQAELASPPGAAPADRLERAVRLSRLSEAASWAWRGQIEQAARRVDELTAQLEAPARQSAQWPQLAAGYTVAPSPWAASYLGARRNIPLRLAKLDQAERASGPLPIVDAELIAIEALRGQPAEIRRKAADVAFARAGSPSITHALLEQLPRAPQARHVSELIEALTGAVLPSEDSELWAAAARRALVERLLAQIAAEGEHGRIERLADLLAESYAARVADHPDSVAPAIAADADALAAALWNRWMVPGPRSAMASAAPVPLAQIELNRAGRLNLASSEVERFAAQQASVMELMTVTVTLERPDAAARLGAILEQAADARAAAGHILGQIEAVEAAMVRIWMERLGRAASPAAPDSPDAPQPQAETRS